MRLPKRHRPGTKWRTLAWGAAGEEKIADSSEQHPGSVFDELVIDQWFHLEQMDRRLWWMAIYREDGTRQVINVEVGERGLARVVSVEEEGA